MPRWLEALLAAVSVCLVLALLVSIAAEVHWQVTHRAEDDAADELAFHLFWGDRHREKLLRDEGNRRMVVPCPPPPLPSCP